MAVDLPSSNDTTTRRLQDVSLDGHADRIDQRLIITFARPFDGYDYGIASAFLNDPPLVTLSTPTTTNLNAQGFARTTTFQYDPLNRLLDEKHFDPTVPGVLSETTSKYDKAGNLIESTEVMIQPPGWAGCGAVR